MKIDPDKVSSTIVAQQRLSDLSKIKETFAFEIIEAMNSYTRARYLIMVEGSDYIIEGSCHSIKNVIRYVKLNLRRY